MKFNNRQILGIALIQIFLITFFNSVDTNAQDVSPNDIEFRRQAVRRIIFDKSQDISLSGLYPSKVIGIDIMHPSVGQQLNNPKLTIENGRLHITADKEATATRWVGGFNPFAAYKVSINKFTAWGEIGVIFRDTDADNRIMANLVAENGMYKSIRCVITKNGNSVERNDFPLPIEISGSEPIRLLVQMMAVGVNLYIEQAGESTLIGRMDFAKHFDLRKKELMNRFEFCLHTSLQANGKVEIDEASAFLSPGIGQSEPRTVTYEDGSPYFKDDRLWLLMTVRGGGLPHPIQGVYSLNPSIFDIKFEGIILYDRGDGLLRNDLASNIIYDRNKKQWIGFTTGFSTYGDPDQKEKKQILAVQSSRMPLKGISIMTAKSINLIADYEDPQCIYDEEAKKWRMLLCENYKGYKAVVRESDTWDGEYKLVSGPIKVNTTGTQIQKIGGKNYALFGSAARKVYVYSYPDLKPVSELNIHRPPWDDKVNTRIWPNVIPLPEGYQAPYMALMMDRLNFPGMKNSWTYGAMYLYYGYLKK